MGIHKNDVFPAPAGMNRNHVSQDASGWSVPRACGDEPIRLLANGIVIQCSPRLRG